MEYMEIKQIYIARIKNSVERCEVFSRKIVISFNLDIKYSLTKNQGHLSSIPFFPLQKHPIK